MTAFSRIPLSVLTRCTDVHQERNVYVHRNPLAREIFWQRLSVGFELLRRFANPHCRVLDFGGGSGAFLPSLAARYAEVTVIDLDLDDARRITTHYRLGNVRLLQADIATWNGNDSFDLVVAMDVLEHFADMEVPRQFLDRYLRTGGLLLVNLPTENLLYELGRTVLRKKKPANHYHSANDLVRYYSQAGYELLDQQYVPRAGPLVLPPFRIAVFRKTARTALNVGCAGTPGANELAGT
jgi:SAM-dependent methyltransferase